MIRCILTFSFIFFVTTVSFGQTEKIERKAQNRGHVYSYWGWNRAWFTKSSIRFKGENYDITLKDIVARDRQSELKPSNYLKLSNFTVPQYNFRIGYFFKDNWDISFGIDHMKYVVKQNQEVKLSGRIQNGSDTYDGIYDNETIKVTEDFLRFEHTDGLNYGNFGIRHSNSIFHKRKINLQVIQGLALGVMLPKTNTTLLEQDRYDRFHFSGYGVSAMVGANITFFNFFFVQAEFKGGYIDLPRIRTSQSKSDTANQDFLFAQPNIVFGFTYEVKK